MDYILSWYDEEYPDTYSITGCHSHSGDFVCTDEDGKNGTVFPEYWTSTTTTTPSAFSRCVFWSGYPLLCAMDTFWVQFRPYTTTETFPLPSNCHVIAEETTCFERDLGPILQFGHYTSDGESDLMGCDFHGDDLKCTDSDSTTVLGASASSAQLAPETFSHSPQTSNGHSALITATAETGTTIETTSGANGINDTSSEADTITGTGTSSGNDTIIGTGANSTSKNAAVKVGAFGAAGVALVVAGLI